MHDILAHCPTHRLEEELWYLEAVHSHLNLSAVWELQQEVQQQQP
jgi:hypothetical protein